MKILLLSFRILRSIDNRLAKIVLAGIRLYQKTFSPDHGVVSAIFHVSRCRFFPTCSDYAIQSLRQYGLVRGTMLSLKRIARCNPMCAGGYDPILKNSKS
ncbi:MAG: membrane protein insertion efficiency factor YidD [bacterium]|nr:membrane protein insertion efficiency factor YidD [bacterium]